jgi:hypothetical protein
LGQTEVDLFVATLVTLASFLDLIQCHIYACGAEPHNALNARAFANAAPEALYVCRKWRDVLWRPA